MQAGVRFGGYPNSYVRIGLVPFEFFIGEFDPGSERKLAAGFIHASRARKLLRE